MPITFKETESPIPDLKAVFTDCRTCGESSLYIQGGSSYEVAMSGAQIHIRSKHTIETEDSSSPELVKEHEVVIYQFSMDEPYPEHLIKPGMHIYGQLFFRSE